MNPRVLLAFFEVLEIWVLHLRSSERIPREGSWNLLKDGLVERIQEDGIVFDTKYVALLGIQLHPPGVCPVSKKF